jgi:hypothetical protein
MNKMIIQAMMADEDEGSPFHHGVKPNGVGKPTKLGHNREISGSPPGVPPSDPFPPNKNETHKTLE